MGMLSCGSLLLMAEDTTWALEQMVAWGLQVDWELFIFFPLVLFTLCVLRVDCMCSNARVEV